MEAWRPGLPRERVPAHGVLPGEGLLCAHSKRGSCESAVAPAKARAAERTCICSTRLLNAAPVSSAVRRSATTRGEAVVRHSSALPAASSSAVSCVANLLRGDGVNRGRKSSVAPKLRPLLKAPAGVFSRVLIIECWCVGGSLRRRQARLRACEEPARASTESACEGEGKRTCCSPSAAASCGPSSAPPSASAAARPPYPSDGRCPAPTGPRERRVSAA